MNTKSAILVLGGPPHIDYKELRVDQTECSYEGIRSGPTLRSYQAVIYWPNSELFSLPTKSRWAYLRRKYPDIYPAIPEPFWQKAKPTLPQNIDWSGRGEIYRAPEADTVDEFIRRKANLRWHPEDRVALENLLREQCISDLWALPLGSKDSQLVIAIAPVDDAKNIPYPGLAYSWLSQWYFARPGTDRKISLRVPPSPKSLPVIFLRLFQLEWASCSKLRLYVESCDPDNRFTAMGETAWVNHLVKGDWEDDNLPAPLRALGMVDVIGGHVSDADANKTLFFKSGTGGVVVIPEPPNPRDLIDLINSVLRTEADAGSATDIKRSIILTKAHNQKAFKHRKHKVLVGGKDVEIPDRQLVRLICLTVARKLPQQTLDPNTPSLGEIDVNDLCWENGSKTKSPDKFASEINKLFITPLGERLVVQSSEHSPSGSRRTLRRGQSVDVSQIIAIPEDEWHTRISDVVACIRKTFMPA